LKTNILRITNVSMCIRLISLTSKLEYLVDHVLTGLATHDNLGISTRSKISICISLFHLVRMLSLGVDSCQVLLLCCTFLL